MPGSELSTVRPRRLRHLAALSTIGLALAGCFGGPSTGEELTYQVDEPVTALVVDARAASVEIVAGDGPVTVTEEFRYGRSKPTTAHRVEAGTLRLSESGCTDDHLRCDVGYHIRVPETTTTEVSAQAGAVSLTGVSGDVHVKTAAGAVEGRALTSDQVTVETEAGAASLEFTEAPTLVRATTSVGAVELRVPGAVAYAVDLHTTVGGASIGVKRDARSAHRIEVSTEVGGVRVEPLP